MAIDSMTNDAMAVEGNGVTINQSGKYTILNWETSTTRNVIQLNGNLYIHILDRNSAYKYWFAPSPGSFGQGSLIVNGGYLIRTGEIRGTTLALTGDINSTTTLEVVGGAPNGLTGFTFNGKQLVFDQCSSPIGAVSAVVNFAAPGINLPDFSTVQWKWVDSFPEVQPTFSDSSWVSANQPTSNDDWPLKTPTSLYGPDYGFWVGALVYRGHFTANGRESTFFVHCQGGRAYTHSVWIGTPFLGSHFPNAGVGDAQSTFNLPPLTSGQQYVITVIMNIMGLEENWLVGGDSMKSTRGILEYTLAGHSATDISWKINGNYGGKNYADISRGPLNKGGFYAERQGWHLPGAPSTPWANSIGPSQGIQGAGIGLYTTNFMLNLPSDYDIPLSFDLGPINPTGSPFTAYLYVNGFQFGKYISTVGPQTQFYVPEGILNYSGNNYLGLLIWAADNSGGKISNLKIVAGMPVQKGYTPVQFVQGQSWTQRA